MTEAHTEEAESTKSLRVVSTRTGGLYQPIRLHYRVPNFQKLERVFIKKLLCMDYDPDKERWVWLYTDEASEIEFAKEPDEIEQPIVLGSFYRKGKLKLVCDVHSIERAVAAVDFFHAHVSRMTMRLQEISIVNRLFGEDEAYTHNHDQFFDSADVVVKPSKTKLKQLEKSLVQAKTPKAKAKLQNEFLQQQVDHHVPEIERFESHFYDDGIELLYLALQDRQRVAIEHWKGNKDYSLNDLFQEKLEQLLTGQGGI